MRMNNEFHQAFEARPMETAIDLSKPGELTVPFRQTCSMAHGEALYVDCDSDEVVKQNLEELLNGLSGNVVIMASDGNEVETVRFNNKTAQYWEGKVLLTWIAPFRNGDYVATIRVDSGAAALANKQQTIYAKYQLCGLEQMPAAITGGFALGASLIGFVAAVCVLPGLLRCGFWRDTAAENA
jgi:hypothetical protein